MRKLSRSSVAETTNSKAVAFVPIYLTRKERHTQADEKTEAFNPVNYFLTRTLRARSRKRFYRRFNLYQGGLAERIAREMYAVARPKVGKAAEK
jgi:hypothetical protein